jgi:transcriptional regulator with XRE-family HTH domain
MKHTRTPETDVWMQLTAQGRKRLATLMTIQDKSQRDVAQAAGWDSHSYVGRLLRGEVDTLKPKPALRIAHFFGVGVDDLFVTRVSSSNGDSHQSKRPA